MENGCLKDFTRPRPKTRNMHATFRNGQKPVLDYYELSHITFRLYNSDASGSAKYYE